MQAKRAFTATFDGREHSAEKGQRVEVPQKLLKALQKQGIVGEPKARTGKENER